jgi:hypothetical protein
MFETIHKHFSLQPTGHLADRLVFFIAKALILMKAKDE